MRCCNIPSRHLNIPPKHVYPELCLLCVAYTRHQNSSFYHLLWMRFFFSLLRERDSPNRGYCVAFSRKSRDDFEPKECENRLKIGINWSSCLFVVQLSHDLFKDTYLHCFLREESQAFTWTFFIFSSRKNHHWRMHNTHSLFPPYYSSFCFYGWNSIWISWEKIQITAKRIQQREREALQVRFRMGKLMNA